MQSYERMAACYDALMDDVDYDAWGRYVTQLLCARGVQSGRVLETACGTGALTQRLLRAGYDVTGLDISSAMLEVAQQRLRKAGFGRCMLICRDMCDIRLHRAADAIVCACDGVNYLTDEKSVRRFFKSAYDNLRAGGVLTFDISSREKLLSMHGQFYTEDRGDIAYIWNNTMQDDVLLMELAFFLQRDDGLYERSDETHRQRAHRTDEILSWLSDAGFADACAYAFGTTRAPQAGDERIAFAAIKKGEI